MPRQEVLAAYRNMSTRSASQGQRLPAEGPRSGRHLRPEAGRGRGAPQQCTAWLAEEQDMLYAQDRWSRCWCSGVGRAGGRHDQARHAGRQSSGAQVSSFKQPSSEELDHDFMWRYVKHPRARAHRHSTVRTTRSPRRARAL
jgi:hypothetical protein